MKRTELSRQRLPIPKDTDLCIEYDCPGCGKPVVLGYNNGKLDSKTCCDYRVRLEFSSVDLVVETAWNS